MQDSCHKNALLPQKCKTNLDNLQKNLKVTKKGLKNESICGMICKYY